MLYEDIHSWLGWPSSKHVFTPEGAGAQMYAGFAKKKIEAALNRLQQGILVKVGVIAADPNSDSSEAPLALVCEFPRVASEEVLDLTHRLAWNLCRTALLITLEPHRLIAWSCYQDPSLGDQRRLCELPTPGGFTADAGTPQQRQVRDLLHWVNLITHRAQQERPKQFPPDGRADTLLLKNLRYVRRELVEKMGLALGHCHDLLARVIFTQFLFHRKDSDGHAFFSENKMARLYEEKELSKFHPDLASVLTSKTDTYALFRWMDERFNGDLFPGKDGEDEATREAAWRVEKKAVEESHLGLLARLVRGDLVASDNQPLLWRFYSFDTIPLEFISSVYEEFLTADERGNDKAYYTPSHLVDYVLDAVLPWSGEVWNLRILDPCCGSGIFLVKAFQRLIHRWRTAEKRDPLVTDLRPILEENLVGVDKNEDAVRVACFSLYLAMADAIEPKHYITRDNVKVFPRLRGMRLIHRDFFDEGTDEIHTTADKESFDLVLGNAPWGDGSIFPDKLSGEATTDYRQRIKKLPPTDGQKWAKSNNWPVANNDIGPLFLAKAAALVKPSGFVAMVNTASLLYWRDGQGTELRKRLFTTFTFEEVTNLSAIRRELFTQAIGPACIVVFGANAPSRDKTLYYYTPKPVRSLNPQRGKPLASQGFSIEPQDVSVMSHAQAAEISWAWSALAVGGSRHFNLIQRLSAFPTLEKLETAREVETRKGVITGDRKRHFPEHEGKPIIVAPDFPEGVFLELDAATLPPWADARATSGDATDFAAFKSPQILIKQSYVAKIGRMRAALVKRSPTFDQTICREAYVSCHDNAENARHIRTACMAYNSSFAVVFFALTSGSFPYYISKISVGELLQLPLPTETPNLATLDSFEKIDAATRKMFGLTSADWNLIEDFLEFTLPDVLRKTPGEARFPTRRKISDDTEESDLTQYAKTFARVVKGTFGKDKPVSATIFSEPAGRRIPVRMLTIHLDISHRDDVTIEEMEADGLLDELTKFHDAQLVHRTSDATGSGLGFQRVAYLFQPVRENGAHGMNLTIVKPDERRYWTRSMAMRDADQLASAIAKAGLSRKSRA